MSSKHSKDSNNKVNQMETQPSEGQRIRKLLFASDPEPPWDLPGHLIRHRKHKTKLFENQQHQMESPFKNYSWSNQSDIAIKILDQHATCFTSNEVVEIIGITCLVNFLFWFLIIACVNFHTRHHHRPHSESSSYDSLVNEDDEEFFLEYQQKGNFTRSRSYETFCDVSVEMQPSVQLKRKKWLDERFIKVSLDNLRPLPPCQNNFSHSMERLII